MENEKKAKRIKTTIAILKFALLISIIVTIPLIVYFKYPEFVSNFNSLESVNAFLEQYKTSSIFIYIGIQVLQIVISVIPGQPIQLAAGYMYPVWLGYVLTIAGIALGSFIAFYLAKLLGRDLLHLIFGEERIKRYIELLNTKKAFILTFLIYLIPGIPKDMFTYAAGVSDMDVHTFLVISLVGRTPGIIASLFIGEMFRTGSYVGMIILIAISIILFILGIIFRKKLFDRMNHWYDTMVTKHPAK